MSEISVISKSTFLGKEIDVYGTPEEPLFKAKDVAEWIEHSDAHKLVEMVDDDEKVRNIVPTLGGNQEMWFLTENGLYEVLMLSRKPIAKQFKKGVKEILKSISVYNKIATKFGQPFIGCVPIKGIGKQTSECYSGINKEVFNEILAHYGVKLKVC